VAVGLLNSVVSAFYYVRVLKAMFLRAPEGKPLGPATNAIALPIVLATVIALGFGVYPAPLLNMMKDLAVPMLLSGGTTSFEASGEMAPLKANAPVATPTVRPAEVKPPGPAPSP
jgi:NADH-quinone oxidoreductase subunit N